jgi:hypothetical protein
LDALGHKKSPEVLGKKMTKDIESDKFTNLVVAWNKYDSMPFNEWVLQVSESYFLSGLTLKMASNFLNCQPAELQAVLNLAMLEDENLILLAKLKPPSTTWFSLAAASTDGLKAAIQALMETKDHKSPFLVVESAIREVEGPTVFERIAGLSSEVFGHSAKKAQTYGLLTDNGIKALKGWQTRVKSGKTLTPAQMAYADGLLRELVTNGAITRETKDGDKELCDEILDALGYE